MVGEHAKFTFEYFLKAAAIPIVVLVVPEVVQHYWDYDDAFGFLFTPSEGEGMVMGVGVGNFALLWKDNWDELPINDYRKIKLNYFLKKENDKLVYEYDFGDGWEHEILLEKILPDDSNFQYPECLKGKMNCPPEDCGGVWGYSDMLEILKNPEHAEYEEYIEWLGGEFDPEHFDINEVNEMLKSKDYGCIEL